MESIASNAIFDKILVLWIMGGNMNDARDLLSAFLSEAKDLSAKLEEDVRNRDALSLRTHSENLHESASAIYSRAIMYFANRIGGAAENYDFETAGKMLHGLEASLKILDGKLRAEGWL